MMRRLLFSAICCFGSSVWFSGSFVHADENNLCKDGILIESDMRIPETEFTQESAKKAAESLSTYLMWPNGWERDMAVSNRMKIIRGYMLKDSALKSDDADAVKSYCAFLKTEAFYID